MEAAFTPFQITEHPQQHWRKLIENQCPQLFAHLLNYEKYREHIIEEVRKADFEEGEAAFEFVAQIIEKMLPNAPEFPKTLDEKLAENFDEIRFSPYWTTFAQIPKRLENALLQALSLKWRASTTQEGILPMLHFAQAMIILSPSSAPQMTYFMLPKIFELAEGLDEDEKQNAEKILQANFLPGFLSGLFAEVWQNTDQIIDIDQSIEKMFSFSAVSDLLFGDSDFSLKTGAIKLLKIGLPDGMISQSDLEFFAAQQQKIQTSDKMVNHSLRQTQKFVEVTGDIRTDSLDTYVPNLRPEEKAVLENSIRNRQKIETQIQIGFEQSRANEGDPSPKSQAEKRIWKTLHQIKSEKMLFPEQQNLEIKSFDELQQLAKNFGIEIPDFDAVEKLALATLIPSSFFKSFEIYQTAKQKLLVHPAQQAVEAVLKDEPVKRVKIFATQIGISVNPEEIDTDLMSIINILMFLCPNVYIQKNELDVPN